MITSQMIATFIDAGSYMVIGVATPLILPTIVQKLTESGKIEKAAQLKKYGRWFG